METLHLKRVRPRGGKVGAMCPIVLNWSGCSSFAAGNELALGAGEVSAFRNKHQEQLAFLPDRANFRTYLMGQGRFVGLQRAGLLL